MFWRVASGSVASPIAAILSSETFTLKDLLAEDDILQELQLRNQQLLDFLLQHGTLEELMHLAVDPPGEELEDEDKFKYVHAASEVLCCKSEEVLEAVDSRPELFQILFKAPEGRRATDSAMSSYFARVVAHFLSYFSGTLMEWLKAHRGVLEGLTERLELTGVAETLVRLVGADDQIAITVDAERLSWIKETRVLPQLLTRLESEDSPTAAENAAEVLTAIARAKSSPLTLPLGSHAVLHRLIEWSVGAPRDEPLVQALNICIALVERRRLWQFAHDSGLASPPSDSDRTLELQAVEALAPHVSRLFTHLSQRQAEKSQETPFGVLRPPLGSGRLTVVALLAVLLKSGLPAAEEAVIHGQLLQLCLKLFIDYPFNSILHHQVTTIVSSILEHGSETLLGHLLEECSLLTWLIDSPVEVTSTSRLVITSSRGERPLRPGYSGHITHIGNKLSVAAQHRPIVCEHLAENDKWREFASGRLEEVNQMEDVSAWECGRPVAGGHDDSAEDNLYGGGPDVSGVFRGISSFETSYDSDSDSDDEELSSRADAMFAEAPDREDDGEGRLSTSSAFGDIDEEPTGASSDTGGSDLSKLFSRRTRMFAVEDEGASRLGLGGDGETASLDRGWNANLDGSPRDEELVVPNSWEDLALDGDEEELPLHRLTHRPAAGSPSGPQADIHGNSGPRVVGFANSNGPSQPVLATSPPSLGTSSLHSVLQASMLSEELRVGGENGLTSEDPPGTDLAELRQPGAPVEFDGGPRPTAPARSVQQLTSSDRRFSNDLDDHPYSGHDSMNLEDLRDEVSSTVAAELDKLDSEGSAVAPKVQSAVEHEEQTLVGSFTKLGSASNRRVSNSLK